MPWFPNTISHYLHHPPLPSPIIFTNSHIFFVHILRLSQLCSFHDILTLPLMKQLSCIIQVMFVRTFAMFTTFTISFFCCSFQLNMIIFSVSACKYLLIKFGARSKLLNKTCSSSNWGAIQKHVSKILFNTTQNLIKISEKRFSNEWSFSLPSVLLSLASARLTPARLYILTTKLEWWQMDKWTHWWHSTDIRPGHGW